MMLLLVLLNLSNVFLEIILLLTCKTLSYAKWLNSCSSIYHVINDVAHRDYIYTSIEVNGASAKKPSIVNLEM